MLYKDGLSKYEKEYLNAILKLYSIAEELKYEIRDKGTFQEFDGLNIIINDLYYAIFNENFNRILNILRHENVKSPKRFINEDDVNVALNHIEEKLVATKHLKYELIKYPVNAIPKTKYIIDYGIYILNEITYDVEYEKWPTPYEHYLIKSIHETIRNELLNLRSILKGGIISYWLPYMKRKKLINLLVNKGFIGFAFIPVLREAFMGVVKEKSMNIPISIESKRRGYSFKLPIFHIVESLYWTKKDSIYSDSDKLRMFQNVFCNIDGSQYKFNTLKVSYSDYPIWVRNNGKLKEEADWIIQEVLNT
ncbi:MAG: hypothetical protein HKN68_01845 [Saprospiraceae bacterium]|nr:hypothetical protein [Saprospiraceae bacterium]